MTKGSSFTMKVTPIIQRPGAGFAKLIETSPKRLDAEIGAKWDSLYKVVAVLY